MVYPKIMSKQNSTPSLPSNIRHLLDSYIRTTFLISTLQPGATATTAGNERKTGSRVMMMWWWDDNERWSNLHIHARIECNRAYGRPLQWRILNLFNIHFIFKLFHAPTRVGLIVIIPWTNFVIIRIIIAGFDWVFDELNLSEFLQGFRLQIVSW